ncbi:hypothetical protein Tco_0030321, partial [Tanacetum coccineum]
MSKNSLDTTNEDLQQLPAVKSETGGLKQKLRHARMGALGVGAKMGVFGAEIGLKRVWLRAEVAAKMAHMGVGLGAEMGDGMGVELGVEMGADMSACGLEK